MSVAKPLRSVFYRPYGHVFIACTPGPPRSQHKQHTISQKLLFRIILQFSYHFWREQLSPEVWISYVLLENIKMLPEQIAVSPSCQPVKIHGGPEAILSQMLPWFDGRGSATVRVESAAEMATPDACEYARTNQSNAGRSQPARQFWDYDL